MSLPIAPTRAPDLDVFASLFHATTLMSDAEECFSAFAQSRYYEDRFAAWSTRTQTGIKQKRAKRIADELNLERARRDKNTVTAMRMVQLLAARRSQ